MSYEIYLIRHGVAEPRGDKWPDDSKRPLTESGMSRMRKVARGLVRLGVTVDVVLTSPLVRARQTAEILASAFDLRPPLHSVDSMGLSGTYAAVIADMEKHSRRSRIALVGHEPNIGELAARLIGSRRAIPFKKGAVCRIDVESLPPAGAGALRWFVPPKLARQIRR